MNAEYAFPLFLKETSVFVGGVNVVCRGERFGLFGVFTLQEILIP